MAIKVNPTQIHVSVDPLSINGSMKILSGNTVQSFNRDSQEYDPDRTLVPLIMMPAVSVIDPEGVMSGNQQITGIEWYEGEPKVDGQNRITNDTQGYEIGDGKVTGFPKFALKVKKNMDINKPVNIHALAVFNDKRLGKEVVIDFSETLYTTYYDSRSFALKIMNQPENFTVNPLQKEVDDKGNWKVPINIRLYSGTNPVEDEHAAYFVRILDNGKYRNLNEEEIQMILVSGYENGSWNRNIVLDARMFRRISLKFLAAFYENNKPQAPQNEELSCNVSIKVEMPHSLAFSTAVTKGGKALYGYRNEIGRKLIIQDNKKIVTYGTLFKTDWFAQSAKPGENEKFIANGESMEFIPAQAGMDKDYPVAIYPSVALYAGHAMITEGETVVTDNDGTIIIDPFYE